MSEAIQSIHNGVLESDLEIGDHDLTRDGVPVDLEGSGGLHAATHAEAGTDPITVSQGQVSGLAGALAGKVSTASFTTHLNDVGNPHTVTKTQVGLGNVTDDAQIPLSQKGAAGGVAELDVSGFVPSAQLPSFVDDVLESANFAALPATGVAAKIYVTLDDNKTYRWSGSVYVEISSSLALGETSSTAHRGDRGKIAYDHSQLATGNPHNTTIADISDAGDAATKDVGTGVGTVAAGNDSRFTDARTPVDHAASHAAGGSDEITVTKGQVTDLVDDLTVIDAALGAANARITALEPSVVPLEGDTVLTRGLAHSDDLPAPRIFTFTGDATVGEYTKVYLNVTGGPHVATIPESHRLGETASITSLVLSNGRHVLTWYYNGTVYILTDSATSITVTPTALSGDVNNYEPTNLAFADALRIDGGAADRIITGINAASFADGRTLTLINIGTTNKLTWPNQSASSTAANRLLGPDDLEIPANSSAVVRYDGVSSRFRPINIIPTGSNNLGDDGWIATVDTWTYASATTFTIAGDRSAIITKGDRIKLTQTSPKYFYVVSSVHSAGTTTITVMGGTDYTLVNAAITSPYFSKVQTPAGFPQWFNYTPTYGGFSTPPAVGTGGIRFALQGKTCILVHVPTTAGTSNATNFTLSLPFNAFSYTMGMTRAFNNGAFVTTAGQIEVPGSSATLALYLNLAAAAWTSSAGKNAQFTFQFEIE